MEIAGGGGGGVLPRLLDHDDASPDRVPHGLWSKSDISGRSALSPGSGAAMMANSSGEHIGRRQCTDTACALLLGSFVYGLWLTYANARSEGNLARLTHGFDWKGDICGVDPGVEDQPLLFWCTPGEALDLRLLDGVCVERCPMGAETSSWCPGRAVPFERHGAELAGQREVVIGMARNLTQQADYETVPALGYCFPKQDAQLMDRIMTETHISAFTRQIFLACSGALENWRFLIGVGIISAGIGYAFLAVLWLWFAQLLYTLVVAAHVSLAMGCYLSVSAGLDEEHNFFVHYMSPATAQLTAWSCAGLLLATWGAFSALCCYGRSTIDVTIDSVRATCEVITQLPTILLQPLVHSVVVLAALLSLLYGFAWILSTGKVVPVGSPIREGGVEIQGLQRNLEFTSWQWGCIIYWVFGLIWICETVNALGQFALSHAVVIHACLHQTERLPLLHGYAAGLRFHLGTLALGGFAIGCLKLVAALLSLFVRQASDGPGSPRSAVLSAMCCCCLGCVSCIERLLAMVNDLIYTDVALRGTGYMEAAAQVVRVAASNPAAYVAIKGSATGVRVLGVTVIGGLGTFLSYQALSSSALHRQLDGVFAHASSMLATSNILGATIAAGFVCFYVALAFMMVFYQTAYTLMYCMLLGAASAAEADDESVCASAEAVSPSCREFRSPRAEEDPRRIVC